MCQKTNQKEIMEAIKDLRVQTDKRFDEIEKEFEPIRKVYRDGAGFLVIIKWFVGTVLTMGALVAIVRGIWHQ